MIWIDSDCKNFTYNGKTHLPQLDGKFWKIKFNGKSYLVHRLVYEYFNNCPLKEEDKIIFIDGDTNNYHYSNLLKKNMKNIEVNCQLRDCNAIPDGNYKSVSYPTWDDKFSFNVVNGNNVIDQLNKSIEEGLDLFFDIETNGLNPKINEVLLLTFYNGKEVCLISGDKIQTIIKVLNNVERDINLVGHNLKFDLSFLVSNGLILNEKYYLQDTFLMSKLLYNQFPITNHGVDDILFKEFNIRLKDFGHSFAELDEDLNPICSVYNLTPNQIIYAVDDVIYLPMLLSRFITLLRKENLQVVYKQEQKFLKELIIFANNGIPFNLTEYDNVLIDIVNSFTDFKEKNKNIDFYNINEIKNKLIEIGYPLKLTNKGNYSLSDKDLSKLEPLITDTDNLLVKYKTFKKLQKACIEIDNQWIIVNEENDKILSKRIKDKDKIYNKTSYKQYLKGIIPIEDVKLNKAYKLKDENELHELIKNKKRIKAKNGQKMSLREYVINGRIYPDIQQFGTLTNRLTMKKPAMQNISRKIKKLIEAPEGKLLLSMDFKAQEPQIQAILCGCPIMLDAYYSGDYHNYNCKLVQPIINNGETIDTLSGSEIKKLMFKDTDNTFRDVMKTISLGLLYGRGVTSILAALRMEPSEENKELITTIMDRIKTPKMVEYQINTIKDLLKSGRIYFGGKIKYFYSFNNLSEIIDNPFNIKIYCGKDGSLKKWLENTDIDVSTYLSKVSDEIAKITRAAKNYPIQGSGGALLRFLIPILMDQIRENNINAQIAHLIHDEIVLEVDENISEETVQLILSKVIELNSEFFNTDKKIILEHNLSKNQKK